MVGWPAMQRGWLVGLLVVTSLPLSLAHAAGGANGCAASSGASSGWTSIRLPFGSYSGGGAPTPATASAELSSLQAGGHAGDLDTDLAGHVEFPVHVAVDPTDPARLYATNGVELDRSTNGGCDWQRVFTLDVHSGAVSNPASLAQEDPAYYISGVVAATVGARHYVYATVAAPGTVAVYAGYLRTPALLEVSRDGGSSWITEEPAVSTPVGTTPVAFGDNVVFAASPSDPATGYLATSSQSPNDLVSTVVAAAGSAANGLFVTHDAGATWQGVAAAFAYPKSYTGSGWWGAFDHGFGGGAYDTQPRASTATTLAVDPSSPTVVWAAWSTVGGPEEVYRSGDGGRSFVPALVVSRVSEDTYDPPLVSFGATWGLPCMVARSAAGAYTRANSGAAWTRVAPGPLVGQFAPFVLGAACLGHGRMVQLTGYAALAVDEPPFGQTKLLVCDARPNHCRTLPSPPGGNAPMGQGSLLVAGTARQPALLWLYEDEPDPNTFSVPLGGVHLLRYAGTGLRGS